MTSRPFVLRFARRLTIRAVALAVLLVPLTMVSRSSAQGTGSNPFAGTFVGDAAPGIAYLPGDDKWVVTIKENGKLAGTVSVDLGVVATAGSCTGTISKQAKISWSGVQGLAGHGTGGQAAFSYSGTVAIDPYNNLFITLSSGKTVYWTRVTVGHEQ
jgi:hypothetical protein